LNLEIHILKQNEPFPAGQYNVALGSSAPAYSIKGRPKEPQPDEDVPGPGAYQADVPRCVSSVATRH
jgi:hypothetical protein